MLVLLVVVSALSSVLVLLVLLRRAIQAFANIFPVQRLLAGWSHEGVPGLRLTIYQVYIYIASLIISPRRPPPVSRLPRGNAAGIWCRRIASAST